MRATRISKSELAVGEEKVGSIGGGSAMSRSSPGCKSYMDDLSRDTQRHILNRPHQLQQPRPPNNGYRQTVQSECFETLDSSPPQQN
jgi:hypothetical protein